MRFIYCALYTEGELRLDDTYLVDMGNDFKLVKALDLIDGAEVKSQEKINLINDVIEELTDTPVDLERDAILIMNVGTDCGKLSAFCCEGLSLEAPLKLMEYKDMLVTAINQYAGISDDITMTEEEIRAYATMRLKDWADKTPSCVMRIVKRDGGVAGCLSNSDRPKHRILIAGILEKENDRFSLSSMVAAKGDVFVTKDMDFLSEEILNNLDEEDKAEVNDALDNGKTLVVDVILEGGELKAYAANIHRPVYDKNAYDESLITIIADEIFDGLVEEVEVK